MQFNRAWLPLNAIRAFEAAARRLSFTKAAEDLRVTQSAVSRQVQRLEAMLDQRLLERRSRDLALTPEGEKLLSVATRSFDALQDALREIVVDPKSEVLRIAMASSFADSFGPQALAGFSALHPDIDLELDSAAAPGDGAQEYDFEVLYLRPTVTEKVMDLLLDEEVTPLCAPALAAGIDAADPVAFLRESRLAHVRTEGGPHFGWECWARGVGADPALVRRGAVMNLASLGARCALEGESVIATDPRLFRREIESGQLVAPFAQRRRTGFGYYLISRQEDLGGEAQRRFRNWLIAFVRERLAAAA